MWVSFPRKNIVCPPPQVFLILRHNLLVQSRTENSHKCCKVFKWEMEIILICSFLRSHIPRSDWPWDSMSRYPWEWYLVKINCSFTMWTTSDQLNRPLKVCFMCSLYLLCLMLGYVDKWDNSHREINYYDW